jgi:hypothetical protein
MLMFIYARNISCNNYGTLSFNLFYRPQFKSNIDESCFIYFAFYIHNYFVIAAFNFKTHKSFTFIMPELYINLPIPANRIASKYEPKITMM